MHKGIIIFGVCQLTKGAIDIFIKNDLIIYGILEDEKKFHHTEIFGVPILGATYDKRFQPLLEDNCPYYIAYSSVKKRKQYLKNVASQVEESLISAIHPSAVMGTNIQLGLGNYIGAQVCLAPEATLHNHCIVHNGVKIESGASIHDFVQIGAGSVIGSNVTLEEEVFIGAGVTIIDGVTIQKGASIGAGSVILGHVKSGALFLGNPAKSIKKE
ncbi:MAG: acetyltransferase [Amoebophilaceae bacterium]|nr:acetyltransferase [Amoebophilaceae bacterium]